MSLEEELESMFLVKDYRWRINGSLVYPTATDIRETIDRAVKELYDEPEGTQLEVGRLIIKKADGHYDVYAMIGEADV